VYARRLAGEEEEEEHEVETLPPGNPAMHNWSPVASGSDSGTGVAHGIPPGMYAELQGSSFQPGDLWAAYASFTMGSAYDVVQQRHEFRATKLGAFCSRQIERGSALARSGNKLMVAHGWVLMCVEGCRSQASAHGPRV
jgi:hypothetical protein